MKYKPLTAGDVRQPGDEVARFVPGSSEEPVIDRRTERYRPADYDTTKWNPVRLIGHAILPADLISCQFRRPL